MQFQNLNVAAGIGQGHHAPANGNLSVQGISAELSYGADRQFAAVISN
jgi:hypothetical protein